MILRCLVILRDCVCERWVVRSGDVRSDRADVMFVPCIKLSILLSTKCRVCCVSGMNDEANICTTRKVAQQYESLTCELTRRYLLMPAVNERVFPVNEAHVSLRQTRTIVIAISNFLFGARTEIRFYSN